MKLLAFATLMSIPLFGDVLYWQIGKYDELPFMSVGNEIRTENKVTRPWFNWVMDESKLSEPARSMVIETLCEKSNLTIVGEGGTETNFNWMTLNKFAIGF